LSRRCSTTRLPVGNLALLAKKHGFETIARLAALLHGNQQAVAGATQANFLHPLRRIGIGRNQGITGTRETVQRSAFETETQSLGVEMRKHQNFAAMSATHHRRYQPACIVTNIGQIDHNPAP
jgi:hypothetical protein